MDILELLQSGLIEKFVPTTYLIVVVVMMLIGSYLKRTKWVKDEAIPLVLIALAFIFILMLDVQSVLVGEMSEKFSAIANMIMVAIIIGTSAVGNHQAWLKQLLKLAESKTKL